MGKYFQHILLMCLLFRHDEILAVVELFY